MMAKAKAKPAVDSNQFPLLQNRLILNRFFCRQLGFEKFEDLRDYLCLGGHTEQEGWEDDGHHALFHVMRNKPRCVVPPDRLAEYDLRIKEYLDPLNRFRTPPVQLKYFQYLAVLFAEIYLDRLFNEKEKLLADLNKFVEHENDRLLPAAPLYPPFTEEDLSKLAFDGNRQRQDAHHAHQSVAVPALRQKDARQHPARHT